MEAEASVFGRDGISRLKWRIYERTHGQSGHIVGFLGNVYKLSGHEIEQYGPPF